ncbi:MULTISPECIES: chromate efflux transporter [Reichenbachiella]|uniref:Chromate transporter n=1 Tax=Reichenbachiella agariperforans TaxID=156994 RepID=A0A1M6TV80_REIAG|nr:MULTISPECIES: chromate efflux transporter [Reichenbachiella]MBU2915592.1 chromate efflux transporter [Reichenbachiella agariperforans]RJE71346.1 chromate transporter [Reichenbachiella sp. MSK19-1]SHK60955.1 chromate transporter [Reichenbachiella agariperforans]
MTIKKVRYYIFLRDVIILAVTAFGGPQAHFAMMLDMMVKKRRYLDEKDFIELHALCQFLPGPTSTQTLTAIGFKVGGPNLAYLTLLVWIIPAFIIMSTAGVLISSLEEHDISLSFTRYIQPTAVGIVSYSAYIIIRKVIHTRLAIGLMIAAAVSSFLIRTPYVFPALILIGGAITGVNYKRQQKEEKEGINIEWANFFLWGAVLLGAAGLGAVTHWRGIDLFENFYRIGSLIFGGGQVLVPFLFTEFVEFKGYLSSEEFLSGYALVQAVPGPVFSFAGFVGSVSMREYGVLGQYLGGFLSAVGVFLPGAFLIFFVIRFWDELKKFRIVKASLDGVNAVSAGMILAAALLLLLPLIDFSFPGYESYLNIGIVLSTILVLIYTKIPAPVLIGLGLILGILL